MGPLLRPLSLLTTVHGRCKDSLTLLTLSKKAAVPVIFLLRMPIGSGPQANVRGRKAGSHHTNPPAGASSVGFGND